MFQIKSQLSFYFTCLDCCFVLLILFRIFFHSCFVFPLQRKTMNHLLLYIKHKLLQCKTLFFSFFFLRRIHFNCYDIFSVFNDGPVLEWIEMIYLVVWICTVSNYRRRRGTISFISMKMTWSTRWANDISY